MEWQIQDHNDYVVLSKSENNRNITMYANRPEFEIEGSRKISEKLAQQDRQIDVIVHRGLSYHTHT